jgi:HEPN domain-containing protein
MPDRSRDWLKQAERDQAQAVDSRQSERHEWACFAAQQAAEKAVQALHLHLGQEAWGHVVAQLLRELPETTHPPPVLIEQAKVLDTFYIASRYPNSHPSGAPFEHFGEIQSDQALEFSRQIIEFVKGQMN